MKLIVGTVFTGKDGTKWEFSSSSIVIGRAASHNVMKGIPGPTSYAKRRVVQGDTISDFSLIIDKFIVDTIIESTQVEARSKTGNADWSNSTEAIYGLLAVMYARGLLTKEQWPKMWGPPIFGQIMSQNKYKE
ncbi:uncharacterized protein [Lepeophtheirus salmonis]|uniref:uncharacterized protein n=1 Tax=Lepeophtheirus salmonis TaxID=72036 RepID=UPI003AF3CA29